MTRTADITAAKSKAETIALECFGPWYPLAFQAAYQEDEDEGFDPDSEEEEDLDEDDLDDDDLPDENDEDDDEEEEDGDDLDA